MAPLRNIIRNVVGGAFNPILERYDAGVSFCSQYQAVYDAMTTPPDAAVAEAQNTMVLTLVDAGIWAKLDVFYLFAQSTNDDSEALINWKNPGTYDADIQNAPAFASLEGFTGNGTDAFISSNMILLTDAVQYTLNDASIGFYVRTDIKETKFIVGARGAASNSRVYAQIYNTSNNVLATINSSGNVSNGGVISSGGLYILQRTASNAFAIYRNNVEMASDTDAGGSLANQDIYFLGYNEQGSVSSPCTQQISVGWIGASLDATERTNIQSAIETYMDSNGKGVIS